MTRHETFRQATSFIPVWPVKRGPTQATMDRKSAASERDIQDQREKDGAR